MLRATLGDTAYRALGVLAGSQTPMSGRMVATALNVAPTTANTALGKLRDAGLVTPSRDGRAYRWHLNTDDAVLRSWLGETRAEPIADEISAGASPYSTGGGGVTFERKVAVQYLAHLLVGDGASELGDGRIVVGVAFQQAPEHSVDDLVISAAHVDELEPSLVLAVAVRRAPDLVQSDKATKKLIRNFVHEIMTAPVDGPEHRVALVVAGAQDHAQQLELLGDLASKQKDAANFFNLVRTPGKFTDAIRGRLDQILGLVKLALIDVGLTNPGLQTVEQHTWGLLSRLRVLMARLESPDEADWATITNSLISRARGADLYGASRLRDRLVALANEYPPAAATVDLSLLQRDVHQFLDTTVRRHRQGWQALAHLHDRAIASTRDEITSGDGSRTIKLDRSDAAAALLAIARSGAAAVVAHGDSGIGKSTLVVRAATNTATTESDTTQALCINLRHLPMTTVQFESALGIPLAALLAELSAPQRLLVIDGADAIAEDMLEPFRYLIDAALRADVTLIAVTASDTRQLVRDTIAEQRRGEVAEFIVPPLTDAQIDEVVATFGELTALATNPRARELLRRPVAVDLLVRGGLSDTPLSDADAMRQVWQGLVRRHGQSDRGAPRAREHGILRLADLALRGGDPLDAVSSIDPAALDGLFRDGLLRDPIDDPFSIGPEFTHDEVRRYALARLMLTKGDVTSKLIEAGVPRWALGAARLACQDWLAGPDTSANPLRGRFARLQEAFDSLVGAGYGDRWGDVPGEALLTLGDPDPVLRDAWPQLCADEGVGLRRLSRLVDQRLRDHHGRVRITAVEPLIKLLLDDETPWRLGEYAEVLLREWLRALVINDVPAGYHLRVRLRDRLIAECAAADRRLLEEREPAAAVRAACSPEEIERRRKLAERLQSPFPEAGFLRRRRRERPKVPREIADEIMVEFLALLGPDLGDDGEAVLRRVGRDKPSAVRPAVEELLTGRALATYQRGLLAELTEAYYLDDEQDGFGFHDDGIRNHHARAFGVMTPLAAWYRGPFMPLLQSDFRNGVAVLNRMLNHAARARSRILAQLGRHGMPVGDGELDAYRTELDITGASVIYVGDGQVWNWYRGTGIGPYPCMSALQALERVCDQLIESGLPLSALVTILLDGCENLAMVGLVVGLLVRHLERVEGLLDPYLAQPVIWNLESSRVVRELSGPAAASDGLAAAERRQWSLREAAMMLVLRADATRAEELRLVGQRLLATARQVVEKELGDVDDSVVEDELVTIRAWASGLDRATYEAQQTEDGVVIQSTPPQEVVQAMESRRDDILRVQEATRLTVRYYHDVKQGRGGPMSPEDLIGDLTVAQDLVDNPPVLGAGDQLDPAAAVAAAALEANLLRGVELPNDALRFAAETVLRLGTDRPPRQFESEQSYFEQGADRSAAGVLPLFLSPNAAPLREFLDHEDGSKTYQRAVTAATELAQAVPNEVRVHLGRGLDPVWETPCAASGTCHHQTGLQLAIETMRDCAFGDSDPVTGERHVIMVDDPVAQAVTATADAAIYFSRFDAAIRALAPAATAQICISTQARDLLDVLLAAQRRALLAYKFDMDDRGTHALIAARALLTLAANGEDAPIFEHVNAYADNPRLLSSFLGALSAAAEESQDRAAAACRIWPTMVSHVIGLKDSGHTPFDGSRYGDYALAALIPNSAGEVHYLYREIENKPIAWWQPLAWQSAVEQWLPHAGGNATCIDQLINFLSLLAVEDRARVGLPWIMTLVLAGPDQVANGSFLVASWLIEIRSAASEVSLLSEWQRVVDALVVAGVTRLAPYSE